MNPEASPTQERALRLPSSQTQLTASSNPVQVCKSQIRLDLQNFTRKSTQYFAPSSCCNSQTCSHRSLRPTNQPTNLLPAHRLRRFPSHKSIRLIKAKTRKSSLFAPPRPSPKPAPESHLPPLSHRTLAERHSLPVKLFAGAKGADASNAFQRYFVCASTCR